MSVDAYDWDEFEAALAPAPIRRRPTRGGAPAAVLAAALWAVDDVVLGEQRRDPVVEEAEIPRADPTQRVVVHLIPGQHRRSWVVVRSDPRTA